MSFLIQLGLFLQVSVQMGTHILLATTGGIACEKAGNTNLGIEGMMLMGASVGYLVGVSTGNPLLAVLSAGFAGLVGSLIYAVITVTLRGNQVVTGLVLSIFGTGFSGYIGKYISRKVLSETVTGAFKALPIPLLSKIPVVGLALFDQNIYVYSSILIAVAMYLYFKYTRWGLSLRAVGEMPSAADASGINVTLYKYIHVLLGGFLAGIAGSYLSLSFVPRWQENIVAGSGWIAVAFIIFSTWNPLQAIAASYLFGILKGLAFKCQNMVVFGKTVALSSQLLDMVPYIATILVLVIITIRKKQDSQAPAALGNAYFREER